MPAMKNAPATSVNTTLKIAPEDVRLALEKLRKIIKAAEPGTTEVIATGFQSSSTKVPWWALA
ncbi:hypothetical protein E6H35_10145 [Candidatus Bathyarchaeota archaeon]|nr:MAG: hypothetical protein E6H35_10145 [Candidatus Bathyarchaeota archaeon]